MDLKNVVEKAVIEHCKSKGYSDKLTKLMVSITHKHRQGEVEAGDLGNFITRVNNELKKMKGDSNES